MTVAYLPATQEISGFKQDGIMDIQGVQKVRMFVLDLCCTKHAFWQGVDLCLGGCVRTLKSMRDYLETITTA